MKEQKILYHIGQSLDDGRKGVAYKKIESARKARDEYNTQLPHMPKVHIIKTTIEIIE